MTQLRRVLAGSLLGLVLISVPAGCAGPASARVEIDIRYSRFEPAVVNVPVGVPVTFVLRNHDPIDHEWIVGDEHVHAVHRTGTEPLHPDMPTEVVLPALETRSTTVIFDQPGTLSFICHLPAHEAYGMVGSVTVLP